MREPSGETWKAIGKSRVTSDLERMRQKSSLTQFLVITVALDRKALVRREEWGKYAA